MQQLLGDGAERMFKKRDPEGKFIFNNVLLNGNVDMLEYILENWAQAHTSLPLTLEGNTSVLHQALCKAAFIKGESASDKARLSNTALIPNSED